MRRIAEQYTLSALSGEKSYDSNLLECNGGHIALTKHWPKYLMERMGFVKCQAYKCLFQISIH